MLGYFLTTSTSSAMLGVARGGSVTLNVVTLTKECAFRSCGLDLKMIQFLTICAHWRLMQQKLSFDDNPRGRQGFLVFGC